MKSKILLAVVLTLSIYVGLAGQEHSGKFFIKNFSVDKTNFTSEDSNKYFILKPGYQLKLVSIEEGNSIVLFITVLNETKLVDGVETSIVEEKEFHDDSLVEISRNYFALDKTDNSIFYFGEEVDVYKNNAIVGHGGSWQAGVHRAKFGLAIPGVFSLGAKYYQEVAPGTAMDRAEIISVNDSLKTSAGFFQYCLKTEETTPLEKGVKEYKIYAPGIGLIKDGTLKLAEYKYLR